MKEAVPSRMHRARGHTRIPGRVETYVVLHELVHLRHRQHDREYWQALGRVMPDYERRREDLMQRGINPTW